MVTNGQILNHLFETHQIDLRRGTLFDTPPSPMPDSLDLYRVEGMMLGLTIGDALGATTEGQLPQKRHAAHGEIRDYLPNRYANGRPVGLPSDDTQLAFWTLEQMIADGGFNHEHVAARDMEVDDTYSPRRGDFRVPGDHLEICRGARWRDLQQRPCHAASLQRMVFRRSGTTWLITAPPGAGGVRSICHLGGP